MQASQASMLASLTNVQQFVDEHAAKLGAVAGAAARKRLGDIVKGLEVHAADQTRGGIAAQGLTKKQKAVREALLRDHMAPIARVVDALVKSAAANDAVLLRDWNIILLPYIAWLGALRSVSAAGLGLDDPCRHRRPPRHPHGPRLPAGRVAPGDGEHQASVVAELKAHREEAAAHFRSHGAEALFRCVTSIFEGAPFRRCAAPRPIDTLIADVCRLDQTKMPLHDCQATMTESRFPERDDDITEPEAPSSEEASKDLHVDVSDADANSVVGGRKAGEGQKDYT